MKLFRRALLVSLLIGLLLSIYGELRRSKTPKIFELPLEVANFGKIWQEERALAEMGDRETLGLSAFKIAEKTGAPEWSTEAIRQYRTLIADHSKSAEHFAYLGAAHALSARDYPVSPILQIFIGPGFIRLYHVWRAVGFLNAAVKMAPQDPVVRLIRGATFVGLPRVFKQYKKGLSDLETLQSWLVSPEGDYADVLKAQSFREEALAVIEGVGWIEKSQ